jgi:hypothetical protein
VSLERRRRDAPVPRATWVAVIVGALLAVLVSVTRSFTVPATVLIAISVLLLVAAVAMQLLGDPPAFIARRGPPVHDASAVAPSRAGWAVWPTALGVAVAWQLWNYLSSPRSDHPTLSHLLDGLTASAGVGRGVTYAVWLAAGWYLVTR